RCWDDFLARPPEVRMGAARLAEVTERVSESRERLAARDYRFFGEHLARRDQWRAFSEFGDRVLYLDIETTRSAERADVTVIGLHDGREMRQFVRGENLLGAEEALAEAELLVTFFGTGFDVPVLRRLFPRLPFDQLHVDLCHTLRRLGLTGGLKAIETVLEMPRPSEIVGLDGWDAVLLWNQHRRGSREALDLLLRYN